MANKPEKFCLKFRLAVNIENKYLFNGIPYTGKDDTRSNDIPVLTDVVLKLMAPLFQRGYNVTCDNYFTSLGLALKLVEKKCSLFGKLCQNGREVTENAKRKWNCIKPKCLGMTANHSHLLPVQSSKKRGSCEQLARGYPCFKRQNPKKKPDLVLYYNKTKVVVDLYDQMTRLCLVKAASRRWPVHLFYNVVEMALINS